MFLSYIGGSGGAPIESEQEGGGPASSAWALGRNILRTSEAFNTEAVESLSAELIEST